MMILHPYLVSAAAKKCYGNTVTQDKLPFNPILTDYFAAVITLVTFTDFFNFCRLVGSSSSVWNVLLLYTGFYCYG